MRYKEQKQLVLQLIKNCEYFHLSEKRSIECINNILPPNKPISRRTYYKYKSELYSDEIYQKLDKRSHYYKLKSTILQFDKRFVIKNDAEIKSLISRQLTKGESDSDENRDKEYAKSYEHINQDIEEFDSPAEKFKENLSIVPKNCTIREEFINCGKELCNLCPHGPYYYAYWRDKTSKKLKKKYLGVMDPRSI
ncbi:MAG: hypothetical protein L0H53_08485 [Candidatus Nitrosocosmicus sp.]|nr:hypothetical protein [Candidatus Nitrosocosmicus sp.]MDN5868536.1 hypothetical protein [Candidatus Nitrosocosmicus sp.]